MVDDVKGGWLRPRGEEASRIAELELSFTSSGAGVQWREGRGVAKALAGSQRADGGEHSPVVKLTTLDDLGHCANNPGGTEDECKEQITLCTVI